jgi:hypothetical protein
MRRHPVAVFGVSALSALIVTVADYLFSRFFVLGKPDLTSEISQLSTQGVSRILATTGGFLAGSCAVLLLTLCVTAGLAGFLFLVLSRTVLGRPMVFSEVLSELRPRVFPLVISSLLFVLWLGLAMLVSVLGPLVFAVVVLVVSFFAVRFFLSLPALVLERGSITQSYKRARLLASESWGRLFCVALIPLLCYIAFTYLPGLFLTPESPFAMTQGDLAVSSVIEFLVKTLIAPIFFLAIALAYLDQRMRKERLADTLTMVVEQESTE